MTNNREPEDYLQSSEQHVHAPRPDRTYIIGQLLSRMAIQSTLVPLTQRKLISNTVTGLKRWSCHSKELPPTSQIKALHVYDFDNTLFMSPLPNKKLWDSRTIGHLQTQEAFGAGGWWHDPRILEATGEGIEKEEPRAWEGWWNENIAQLVELSMEQHDALTVLLTGRGEHNFADLIKRIVASRNFAFDMICLKPEAGPNNQRFSSTMKYKQAILEDLVHTYKDADEIRIYEDRPKHTKGFREFFEAFNSNLIYTNIPAARKSITAEVIQVTAQDTTLDPVIEVAEVQRLINAHNIKLPPPPRGLEIKRTIFYTGYLISHSDTAKLLPLVKTPPHISDNDVKFLGNNILISHGPAQPHILNKVGGLGCKQTWQVTAIGVYQSTIWAARVTPVPPTSVIHTEYNIPYIILAQFKSTPLSHASRIQNWQMLPPDKQYIIQTSVGEKVQLRVEHESEESEYESLFDRKALKRKHTPPSEPGPKTRIGTANDENRRFSGGNPGFRGGNQNRGRGGGGGGGSGGGRGGGQNTNRGGRGSSRGGGGGNGRGRGGGGQRGYKSLDDVGTGGGRYNAQRGEPNYDDYVPGGGGYDAAFPSIRGAGGDGGLPYGK